MTTTFELPKGARIWPALPNETLGFDGAQLWGYAYQPAHGPGHMGIAPTSVPETCTYEVYDAHSGARLRTLAGAIDDWAGLSENCKAHALIPTSDGGAIAVSIQDPKDALVVKFATAP
jgi:hypothetical protein